jgi:hypothetical protein
LEKGQPYQVVAKQGDRIVLKDEWETYRLVDTAFQKTVYRADKLEIAVGERLKFYLERERSAVFGQQRAASIITLLVLPRNGKLSCYPMYPDLKPTSKLLT